MFSNTAYEAVYQYLGLELHSRFIEIITSQKVFLATILIIFGFMFFMTSVQFFSRYLPGALVWRRHVPLAKYVQIVAMLFLSISILKVGAHARVKQFNGKSWDDNRYVHGQLKEVQPQHKVSFVFDVMSRTAEETAALLARVVDSLFQSTNSQLDAPNFFFKALMYGAANTVDDPDLKRSIHSYTDECFDRMLPLCTQEPLLVEKHFGAVDRKYTSFYIPKQDQMPFAQSVEKLSGFLKSNHASPRAAEPLLTKSRAMVSKDGSIRVFGESGEGGAWEYHQGKDGAWSEKKQGVFLKPFLKHAARGTQLFVYTHPKHYLSAQGNKVFRERNQRDGILVLMEPNAQHVERYLSENKSIRKVHVITPKGQELFKSNLDFFNVLKQKLHANKLDFKMESMDRVKSHDHSGMSL